MEAGSLQRLMLKHGRKGRKRSFVTGVSAVVPIWEQVESQGTMDTQTLQLGLSLSSLSTYDTSRFLWFVCPGLRF